MNSGEGGLKSAANDVLAADGTCAEPSRSNRRSAGFIPRRNILWFLFNYSIE